MHIDAYTTRHTRRDAHPWRRMVIAVSAIGCTLVLATACDDDRATNPIMPKASPAVVQGGRYPDGRFAFLIDSVNTAGERTGEAAVFVMNPDMSGLLKLTPYGSFYGPAWSPDRKKIAFADDVSGMIGVVSASGKNLRWLTNGSDPSWSPDGRRIVFTRTFGLGNSELYVMNADGTGVLQLSTVHGLAESDPSWSPDGKWIAFVAPGTQFEIYVMSASGSLPTRITNCAAQGMGCRSPEWSPRLDSLSLAYVATSPGLSQLRVHNTVSGAISALASEPGPLSGPTWSPDGTQLLFGSQRGSPGRQALFSVEIATDAVERRSFFGAGEHAPSWR